MAKQKQHLIDMMKADEDLGLYKEETKCYCGHTTYCDCGPEQTDEKGKPMTYWGGLEEPKQEELLELFKKDKRCQIYQCAKELIAI